MGSGDWNDGMNLVGAAGQGRKRVARLLPLRRADAVRRARARAGRRAVRRALRDRGRPAARATSKRTAGTAAGIAAPTSTTARRWARRRTPNARSIPSRKAGRCCPARANPSARGRRWTRSTARLVRRDHALVQLLDPPFDTLGPGSGLHPRLRARRARERRPVHACGDLGGDGVRRAGRRRARLGTARHDQSAAPWRVARADRRLQGGALRRRGRRLRGARRTPAAAAGPGTPVRPAGCTG